jgi:hypothetical protein
MNVCKNTTKTFSASFPLVYGHVYFLRQSIMSEHRENERTAFLMINKSDLDKKDFSNVYCGLESS